MVEHFHSRSWYQPGSCSLWIQIRDFDQCAIYASYPSPIHPYCGWRWHVGLFRQERVCGMCPTKCEDTNHPTTLWSDKQCEGTPTANIQLLDTAVWQTTNVRSGSSEGTADHCLVPVIGAVAFPKPLANYITWQSNKPDWNCITSLLSV